MTERYALVSVTDKSGIVDFARSLMDFSFRIVSTGGTGQLLEENGIDVIPVSEWTGMPEMLNGRVKTLHPAIHAGILARRDRQEQMEELSEQGIRPIDLVVVNLYDVRTAIEEGKTEQALMEEVDIGGPTMMRAAAKNHHSVTVVPDPSCYDRITAELEQQDGQIIKQTRKELARKTFRKTSSYDRAISSALGEGEDELLPEQVEQTLNRTRTLRYGENPHQEGGLYALDRQSGGFPNGASSIHGKELSYNNLMDLDAAYRLLADMGDKRPACTVIKHMIPCGAAEAGTPMEAFEQAHAGDPTSAFGSIVGFNVPLTEEMARKIATDDYYIEAILAPEIEEGVTEAFEQGPGWGDRVRLVPTGEIEPGKKAGRRREMRSLSGGVLLQQGDGDLWPDDVQVVGGELNDDLKQELSFAWMVCKHVRSNAIVLAKDRAVVGVGAGQPSRVDAAEIAVDKAGERAEGAVLASDAFFPFPDALEVGMNAGIRAAVQPGGSVNDEKVIQAAEERGIPMVLTGQRHFKH